MNKMKKFLLSKGMYLVAIVCVAVICLGGLYIAQNFGKGGEQGLQSQKPADSTGNVQDVIAVPTRKNETASPVPTITLQSTAATPSSTPAPTTSASTATKNPTIQLQKPVDGKTLTDYAMDKLVYNKTLDEWRTHSGVDMSAALNTEVKAAAAGKVVDAKKDPRLGYLIILEHENGFKTIYANLKEEANVKIGDMVNRGDVLGWVGATAPFEYAEEAHLHFEVLHNDICVNPWLYLS